MASRQYRRHLAIAMIMIVLPVAAVSVASGCSAKKNRTNDVTEAPVAENQPQENADTIKDFCGMSVTELATPELQTLSKTMSGVPQVINGRKVISYKIIATPEVQISATNRQTTSTVTVAIKGDSSVAQIAGEAFAKKKAGQTTSKRLLASEVAALAAQNPQFAGLSCGPVMETEIVNKLGVESGTLRFYPAILSSINARGALAMYKKEFGQARTLPVTAEVVRTRTGYGPVGMRIPGQVTVKETDPNLSINNGEGFTRNITADVAIEIVTDFGGIERTRMLGLPIRQVYYIDTKKRDLVAILHDYKELNPSTGTLLPETVLLAP